ncbi:uncharacterized protein LOC115167329 isoform X2 [Salmo trutta]|uniref:uncharacterized protein LOC115167329 isoform X2 n=1 Tax=Salmo trutta TaxID=8032 RepID=UPI0011310387|nr:uncharacterized protein LOC115167329 isoform X2 [Salmo trutta]
MCVFNISRVTWVIGSSVMQPHIMIKDASNRPLLFPGYSHLKTVHDDAYLPPQSFIVSDRPRESQKATSHIMGPIFLMIFTVTAGVLAISEEIAVYPAMLFGSKAQVRKGDTIDLKCNISGIIRFWDKVHVYIYKNGVEMAMKVLEKGEDDAIFTMKDVTREDSGNYSCVYTRDKLLLDQVKSAGKNLVAICVYEEAAHDVILVNVIRLISSAVVVILLLTVVAVSSCCSKRGALQCYCGRTPQQEENDVPMTGEGDDGTSNMEEESSDEFAYESVAGKTKNKCGIMFSCKCILKY